jgi:hypothetical protein
MSIAVDDTIGRFSGTPTGTATISSGSFTAPADALLWLSVEADSAGSEAFTLNAADSGGLTWTKQVERTAAETTAGAASAVFTARTTSAVSRTVQASRSADSASTRQISAKVRVLTGVDVNGTPVDTVGANNEGGATATPATTSSLTPGATGILGVACADWNVKGPLSSSNLTVDAADHGTNLSVMDGWRVSSNGVGITANLTASLSGPQFKWTQITVREAVTAALSVLARPQSRPFPFAPGSSGMLGRL